MQSANYHITGPIFLQTTPILVQVKKIGIIFDCMILLRIFVFRDHLKGNFLNSQQPISVCEVSWLNFYHVRLYHVHDVPYYLWKKSRITGSIPFDPEPGSKSRRSYSVSNQKYWAIVIRRNNRSDAL